MSHKVKASYKITGRGIVLIIDGPSGIHIGDKISIEAEIIGVECGGPPNNEEGLLIRTIEINVY